MDLTADVDLVRESFNRIAADIDNVVVRNPINAWMHAVTMARVRAAFLPGARILELGCGTGTDAIAMAQGGRRVFAFDLSPEMVARARAKVAAAGLEDRVVVAQGRTRDLRSVVGTSPWSRFDGAYANFTLTYEEDLEGVARDVAEVLLPGARFLFTVPNRLVLSEVAIYGPLLRFSEVLGRFARPLRKDIHGTLVEIHAWSPGRVVRALRPRFRLVGMAGVPVFLPPVYLHEQYRRLGGGQRLLQGLDRRLGDRFPWNRLGEHTLFEFERVA